MIGNETGYLIKGVKLYKKIINMRKTLNILRSVAATSLYFVKSYDKTNMKLGCIKSMLGLNLF